MLKIAVMGVPGAWSTELLADMVASKTGYRKVIEFDDLGLDLSEGNLTCNGELINDLDGIVLKKIGITYSAQMVDKLEVLKYLEMTNRLRFFSKIESISSLINRVSCTVKLQANGLPMPNTFLTENIDEAISFINKSGKVVLKPLFSTKARGMIVLDKSEDLNQKLIDYRNEGNSLFYIQKLIEKIDLDLGVTFLGGNYIGTYARVKQNDSWNTTTNNGGVYKKFIPENEIIDLAYQAQKLFDLDFTCVDVVLTSEGPKIFEVSAFGGFRGLKEGCSINAAELYTNHIIGKLNEN